MKDTGKGGMLHALRDMLIPARQSRRQVLGSFGLAAGFMAAASVLSAAVNVQGESDVAVPLIYVLAVLLTARLTDGYFYSMLASVVAVICVNYAFTYPYFAFNFTITGYPLTFIVMFSVSLVVGMLTSQVKRQGRIQAEAEKIEIKANLLRSVSHDLRTPLTSIIGSSGAILDAYDAFGDEEKKEMLTHVRDEAQSLVRMVENILSITRIQEGTVQIRKSTEAAEEIAAEAVSKFRGRFPDMPVSVSVPDELLLVPMDPMLIEQVLINLMENVVRHADNATRIVLSIGVQGDMARFRVEDDGVGIDEKLLPRLFEELFPVSEEKCADGHRNMGIGLSVCSSIVRGHGGRMSAQNMPQGGACVSFVLPLKEE